VSVFEQPARLLGQYDDSNVSCGGDYEIVSMSFGRCFAVIFEIVVAPELEAESEAVVRKQC